MNAAPFAHHCAVVPLTGIIAPRRVTVEPVRVNRSLLSGNAEQVDAFADEQLRKERQRLAAQSEEVFTEGRQHRQSFRSNPHD